MSSKFVFGPRRCCRTSGSGCWYLHVPSSFPKRRDVHFTSTALHFDGPSLHFGQAQYRHFGQDFGELSRAAQYKRPGPSTGSGRHSVQATELRRCPEASTGSARRFIEGTRLRTAQRSVQALRQRSVQVAALRYAYGYSGQGSGDVLRLRQAQPDGSSKGQGATPHLRAQPLIQ